MLDVPLFSFPFSLVTRMVLALLKWFKETGFYKKKKKKNKDMSFAFNAGAGRKKKLARCFKK